MASWRNLETALLTIEHPVIAEREMERAMDRGAAAARKRIRAKAPRARGLPPGSHYASGTPRRPGDLVRAVGIRREGAGFHAKRRVTAGGVARIIIPGAKAHEIAPKGARALSMPANFTTAHHRSFAGVVAFAHIAHPAIEAHPFVEEGAAEVGPEIDAIMAETGRTIVAEMAAAIGGLP